MTTTYPALFLFAGSGLGALGFKEAAARLRGVDARFTIAGAVDNDPACARDFEQLTGHPCAVADIGRMTPAELRAVCPVPPAALFTSPPCKGNSGCLPAARACEDIYQEMNRLAVVSLELVLEAWPDSPPRLILLENVPRITVRSRDMLDELGELLRDNGYAVRETSHDCGELGELAQHRRRFLLVARHTRTTRQPWMQPARRRLRAIGDVLGPLPVPYPWGSDGGTMHRLPRLSFKNWVRLALIPAGGDWRDLPDAVQMKANEGRPNAPYGVEAWDDAGHAVVAAANVRNARAAVADPRVPPRSGRQNGGFGVESWREPGHTVVAEGSTRNTRVSVADPRVPSAPRNTAYGVEGWTEPAGTVVGAACHDNGPFTVADPRVTCAVREGAYGVRPWGGASAPIIGHPSVHNWPGGVADPRPGYKPRGGSFGVQAWTEPGPTVIGETNTFHGANAADPRLEVGDGWNGVLWVSPETGELCGPAEVLARFSMDDRRSLNRPPLIIAADGTWHRPMTTLELAALQDFPVTVGGEWLELDGRSHKRWREAIGNAVPRAAARAMGAEALRCLIASDLGVWAPGGSGVWVERREESTSCPA